LTLPVSGQQPRPRTILGARAHTGMVTSVAFSGDGKLFASGSVDHTVRLWDVTTGEERGILKGHRGGGGVKGWFSPNNQLLASAGFDGTVRLWDVAARKEKALLKGYKRSVFSVAFSPNGKLLASAGNDGTVRLWAVATGKQKAALNAHTRSVFSVAFS